MMDKNFGGEYLISLCRGVLAAGVIIFLALGALTPQAQAEMEHATLSLPADGMHFLALYAAQDFHFLEQQGLDLKIVFIAGIGSFNAVVSGGADFSVGSGASLARAAARGQRMLAMPTRVRKEFDQSVHALDGHQWP